MRNSRKDLVNTWSVSFQHGSRVRRGAVRGPFYAEIRENFYMIMIITQCSMMECSHSSRSAALYIFNLGQIFLAEFREPSNLFLFSVFFPTFQIWNFRSRVGVWLKIFRKELKKQLKHFKGRLFTEIVCRILGHDRERLGWTGPLKIISWR